MSIRSTGIQLWSMLGLITPENAEKIMAWITVRLRLSRVEVAGFGGIAPTSLAQVLGSHNIRVSGIHTTSFQKYRSNDDFIGWCQKMSSIFGCNRFITNSSDGLEEPNIARLSELAKKLNDCGMELYYHTYYHDFENDMNEDMYLRKIIDRCVPGGLKIQIDTYFAAQSFGSSFFKSEALSDVMGACSSIHLSNMANDGRQIGYKDGVINFYELKKYVVGSPNPFDVIHEPYFDPPPPSGTIEPIDSNFTLPVANLAESTEKEFAEDIYNSVHFWNACGEE